MEASSIIVIKVKYENVLRRFKAPIVDGKFFLSMDGLREKIVTLFSFAPDTHLLLTYVDEDGDVVTLVDDDDLRDVVKQALNPLRVTVKVNDKNGSRNNSNASATPLQLPHVQHLPNLTASVSEILRKVPEPLFEALLKLSGALAAKASLSSSCISELVDNLSKASSSLLGQQLSDSGVRLNMQNGAPASSSATDNKACEPLKVKPSSKLQKVKPATNMKRKEIKIQNVTGHKEEDPFDYSVVAEALDSQNVYVYKPASHGVSHTICRKEKGKKTVECSNGKSDVRKLAKFCVTSSNLPSQVNTMPTGNDICNSTKPKFGSNSACDGPSYLMNGGHFISRKTSGLSDALENAPVLTWSPYNGGLNLGVPGGTGLIFECPFSSTSENISGAPLHCASDAVPLRSNSQNDSSGSILHHGVSCDGCNINPIIGPRFQSKVKPNYDLCHSCFQKMGTEDDYTLIDRIAVNRDHLRLFRVREQGAIYPRVTFSKGQWTVRPDSCFIQDVNIFDGTIMAPLTPFTKIWRMRNNGRVAWPQKTQLVWIGGDKLTETRSVEIQIPASGLLMDQELDVAVDFISPELPGRYISYWRMATPSGQKFGQRVWVLIQVEPCNNETPQPHDSVRNLNLNLPPASTAPEIITVDPAPVVANACNSKKVVEPRLPSTENELKFPINDSLLVGNGSGSISVAPSSSSSSESPVPFPVLLSPLSSPYSMGPLNAIPPPPPPPPSPFLPIFSPNTIPNPPFFGAQPPPPTEAVAMGPEVSAKDAIEEKLVRKLEEMGFKQVDLNKEVLRLNEYDLEQSVDDLCGVAEWDPILEELTEMGFREAEVNRVLLKKNKGSITRVVMDLIAGEEF